MFEDFDEIQVDGFRNCPDCENETIVLSRSTEKNGEYLHEFVVTCENCGISFESSTSNEDKKEDTLNILKKRWNDFSIKYAIALNTGERNMRNVRKHINNELFNSTVSVPMMNGEVH